MTQNAAQIEITIPITEGKAPCPRCGRPDAPTRTALGVVVIMPHYWPDDGRDIRPRCHGTTLETP